MSYKLLEHASDIAIRACARTKSALFSEAVKALLEVMADPRTVRASSRVAFNCRALKFDLLFVEFLNEILCLGARKGQLFKGCAVSRFEEREGGARVEGVLKGEPLNPARHVLRTEVKAATYSGLKCERQGHLYCIQCVLDV